MKNVPNLLRPEEVVAVSNALRKRLERDKDDFFSFSDCFNIDFIRRLSTSIEAAKLITDEAQINNRIDECSIQTRMVMERLSNHMNDMFEYISKNEPDTAIQIDFTLLLSNIKQRKVDAIITLLRRLINKFDTLPSTSQEVKKYASEVAFIFADLNFVENEKSKLQREKDMVIQENQVLVNSLWRMVESISNAGLLIYRRSNPDRAKEYSLAELRSGVNQVSSS